MASREDCFFFFNSSCTKGDHCAFRHEKGALGSTVACEEWKNGSCNREPCYFRHGPVAETPRMPVVCFFESSPTGCLNSSCQYFHHKPRPFLTNNAQFQTGVQRPQGPRPGGPPPGGPPPRFISPPYAQRLVPNPITRATGQIDFSGTKIPGHFRAAYPNRLPIPPNHPGRPTLFPRPAVYPVGAHDVMNVGTMPSFGGELARPSFLPRDSRMVPGMNNIPSLMSGEGIRVFENFPEKNPRDVKQMKSGQSMKESRNKRSSSKRTVKKLDNKRSRKTEKISKRSRDESRTRQDATTTDRKRRKSKDSRLTFTKLSTDSSKRRKREKDDSLEKTKISPESEETIGKDDDLLKAEDFSFKVKTLEEILRDKALKKLRERQAEKSSQENSTLSIDEDDPSFVSIISSPNTTSKPKTPTIVIEDDNLDNIKIKTLSEIRQAKLDDNTKHDNAGSPSPQYRTLKPLKPLTHKKKGRQVVIMTNSTSTEVNEGSPIAKSPHSNIKTDEFDLTPNLEGNMQESGVVKATIPRKTLPPLRKLTKPSPKHDENSPEHDNTKRTTENKVKRKIEQQTYRKLVKTSRLRLTSASLQNASSHVKEKPVDIIEDRSVPQNGENVNTVSKETENCLTGKKLGIKESKGSQSDNITAPQGVKKIKLARKCLKSPSIRSQEGRRKLNMGRQLKLNKKSCAPSKLATNETNVVDTTSTKSTITNSTNIDISRDEKCSEIQQTLNETKEQRLDNATTIVSTNVLTEPKGESSLLDTTSIVIPKEEEESNTIVEGEGNVTGTDNYERTIEEDAKLECLTQGRHTSTMDNVLSKQSSLDQIVKEVNDDMICEEDALLDEDLETAIANLSPASTDDEDNISINADDLLLEIEEMINS